MPKASVKVMRSYDYCHFEICLASDNNMSLIDINSMRKDAALLVDEAVRQYIISKAKAHKKLSLMAEKERLLQQIEIINTIPQSERTAEDKAKIKALEDKKYWEKYNYSYDDDDE